VTALTTNRPPEGSAAQQSSSTPGTVESEAVLAAWFARVGGDLVRIAVQRGEPVGGFTGWKAAMPVTIWSGIKS
jgi:precorrin-6B methylase 2